jgi:hypothetical protein
MNQSVNNMNLKVNLFKYRNFSFAFSKIKGKK